MREMNFDHQDVIFSPELAVPVTVIGAGSVGSQAVVSLARLGFTAIDVWDGDGIESHNIPMSAYRVGDLGRPKVDALAEIVRDAMGVDICPHREMYNGQPLRGPVVCCVDSMEARSVIWSQVKRNPFVPLLVDTRIAEEFVSVFAIRPCEPGDAVYYEHYWHPSSEALMPLCGRHNAIHVSGTAAHAACAALTEWLKHGTTQRHLEMLCGHFRIVSNPSAD